MARKKNSLLRTIIPLAAILAGAGLVAAVAVNSSNQPKGPQQQAQTTSDTDQTPLTEQAEPTESASEPGSDQPQSPPPASPSTTDLGVSTNPAPETGPDPEPTSTETAGSELGTLRARKFEDVPEAGTIGSIDGEGGHHILIEFSRYGAGIGSLKLGEGYFKTVGSEEHVELQAQRTVERPGQSDLTAVPFAALAIEVNGSVFGLASPGVWRPVEGEAGAFEAVIEDENGLGIIRLERRFVLDPGTFRLHITRRTHNLSTRPVAVRWFESGPIDLPEPTTRYGGDKRRARFGYLLNEQLQAGAETVTADQDLKGRRKILGKRLTDPRGYKSYTAEETLWPTTETTSKGRRMVWSAFTSRYFAVATHPLYDPMTVQPGGKEKIFSEVERIDRLVLNPYATDAREAVILVRMTTARARIEPGAVSEISVGVFAGPLLDDTLVIDDLSESLNLKGMIVYNFGGMCGEMCTFGWLTHVLFFVLRAAHSLTFDWAASIILLVLIVRTALHPITRWSQIRLQRFSKQMSALGPKQAKLREKYKDDPKRQQTEMARLWKEEGINPAGALGCLPMFLQSPVWIALYATLYFAAEMRHEPGFWGVFQTISGGHWGFLADLSSPDAALPLPGFMHFTPPLLGGLYGRIESVNLLPILMGVLFFMHQKYLSPPPSASMTPEQESQQKLMRVMFPLMMPIFMYPAPSGLCIYFITNSALAIIENKHIRSSAEKQGLLDPEKIKAEKMAKRAQGKGGFMTRLHDIAEQRQKEQAGKGAKAGKKQVQNVAKPDPKLRSYKKRK